MKLENDVIESVDSSEVMENGSDNNSDVVQTVSGGDASGNVVYVQSVEEEFVDLWQADITDFSTTDGLLLLILIVLILQLFFKRW